MNNEKTEKSVDSLMAAYESLVCDIEEELEEVEQQIQNTLLEKDKYLIKVQLSERLSQLNQPLNQPYEKFIFEEDKGVYRQSDETIEELNKKIYSINMILKVLEETIKPNLHNFK